MLLAIDIGNSSISIGLFDGAASEGARPALLMKAKIASDSRRSPDEYRVVLRSLLSDAGYLPAGGMIAVTEVVIGSVVPSLTHDLRQAAAGLCPAARIRVVGEGMRSGVLLSVDDPGQVGADIVANAAAAVWLAGTPAVILDFGTATVMTAVDAKRTLLGVSIAPGLRTALEGLRKEAAQLPYIELKKPASVLGRSTPSAAQSGIVFGSACMADGMIDRILSEYRLPPDTPVLATGGLCGMIVPLMTHKAVIEPDLTLYGLFRMSALTAAKENPKR